MEGGKEGEMENKGRKSVGWFSSDQGLLLEGRSSSIKDKHRFDVVVEQFADASEQESQVSAHHRLPLPVPHPPHRLVQPQAHV